MTLPPVVSDAGRCSAPECMGDPHDWEMAKDRCHEGEAHWWVCRYCGGRKPTDAAPSREGRG